MNINIKGSDDVHSGSIFPKVENVEIPLGYKTIKRHRLLTEILVVLTMSEKVKLLHLPLEGFTLLCFSCTTDAIQV